MPTTLTWLGHAAFQIQTPQQTLLIDPFLTDNPAASCSANSLDPDVILLTHGHADHVGDTIELARRANALVIANYEIAVWLGKQGVKNTHGMQMGGQFKFDFGTVLMTIAFHGSQLPDGSDGGQPAGLVLKLHDGTIYHAGDTALFSDMSLIGEEGLDIAILPIGDNFTMGPAAAARAVKFLNPKRVIPCHYNTWPLIEQDGAAWGELVRNQTGAEPCILAPGESLTLGAAS